MHLTKDAKFVLYTLYKEYADRRKHGFSKSQSKNFKCAKELQCQFFPHISLEDIVDSLRELDRNEFVNNTYASGDIQACELSDYAIFTMESFLKDTVLSVADFVLKFLP